MVQIIDIAIWSFNQKLIIIFKIRSQVDCSAYYNESYPLLLAKENETAEDIYKKSNKKSL